MHMRLACTRPLHAYASCMHAPDPHWPPASPSADTPMQLHHGRGRVQPSSAQPSSAQPSRAQPSRAQPSNNIIFVSGCRAQDRGHRQKTSESWRVLPVGGPNGLL
eukprot:352495-Chlamydomonas_euryale.AAC.2